MSDTIDQINSVIVNITNTRNHLNYMKKVLAVAPDNQEILNGNNAGMLFKKEAKAATNIGEYRSSLERLRMRESSSNDNGLRKYTN